MSMTDTLRTFLNDPRNTASRERMFFNRLYFDLKLAAAARGYPLSIFEPEVDREGYDVVIDDADMQRRFQLKIFTHSFQTSVWSLRFSRRIIAAARSLGICDYFEVDNNTNGDLECVAPVE